MGASNPITLVPFAQFLNCFCIKALYLLNSLKKREEKLISEDGPHPPKKYINQDIQKKTMTLVYLFDHVYLRCI